MTTEQVEKGMKCCEEFLCGECPYEQYNDKINNEFTIRCMHKLMVDINKLYFKDENMDNNFFNFDAVVEIEKRKSYNQAIEDFFMKALEAYHDDKLNECELCNIERRLKEKSIE